MTTTEVAVQQASNVAALPTRHLVPSTDLFSDPAAFEHAQRVAKVFASSKLVPQHMQGNTADCLIALQIARRLNEEPLTVMQQIYIVNGRPGWYTSYMISRVNRAGILKGPITWEEAGEGDALTVTAKAVLAATGEEIRASADMRMAAAEGWTKNAKYKSMPAHMLRWRSAAMLIRLYAPEVMLGMPAVEELETMPKMRDVTPAKNLADKLDALAKIPDKPAPAEAAETHDPDTGEITDEQGSQQEAPNAPAAGQPASDPDPSQRKSEQPGAGAAARAEKDDGPKTAAAYLQNTHAWIENLLDADAGEKRWRVEKAQRNKLNVDPDDRDRLDAALKAKITALRSGTASHKQVV